MITDGLRSPYRSEDNGVAFRGRTIAGRTCCCISGNESLDYTIVRIALQEGNYRKRAMQPQHVDHQRDEKTRPMRCHRLYGGVSGLPRPRRSGRRPRSSRLATGCAEVTRRGASARFKTDQYPTPGACPVRHLPGVGYCADVLVTVACCVATLAPCASGSF